MKYHEMVKKVQETCGLDEENSAHSIKTIIETLGERLPATERKHFTDQLPAELKQPASKREYVNDFDLETFYTRIAAREKIRYTQAMERTHCVMTYLQKAISAGEINDIKNFLPEEYGELFGEPPQSSLSPSAV